MRRWRSWLCAPAFVLSIAAAATASAQEAKPAPDAIRAYAEKFRDLGPAPYAAALRRAIDMAADALATGENDYDTSKPITLGKLPTRAPGAAATHTDGLAIDKDERYLSWLEAQAKTPVIDVNFGNRRVKLRSVGGQKITRSTFFPEITLAYDPPAQAGGKGVGFCSGVLIDRETVLTVAHCLCGQPVTHVILGVSMASPQRVIKVKGERRSDAAQCPGGSVTPQNHWMSLRGHDIAVLRLAELVPEAAVPVVKPPAPPGLIATEFAKGNRALIVVGFGQTEQGDEDQKNLSIVPILSPDCSGAPAPGLTDESAYGCLKGAEILAKDRRRLGPCHGDSGGGAYILVDKTEGDVTHKEAMLVGLVSRSILRPAADCGDGGIYTLLTRQALDWATQASAALAK
jgi:hypothetical protein